MGLAGDRRMLIVLGVVLNIFWTLNSSEITTSSEDPTCKMEEVESHLDATIAYAIKAVRSFRTATLLSLKFESCPPKPEDCSVLFDCGKKSSGIYTIWPKSRILGDNSIQAYCDMDSDGGGWTVIQRRGNFGRAEDYFYQGWNAYKEGFGNPSEDFWMGNDNIFAISNQNKYSIRFDLKDFEDNVRWATYDHFWIDSEDSNYTLHVRGYKGNASDDFSYHSGEQFSTKDRDNDRHGGTCAVTCRGAWWYKSCYQSTLNGLYLIGYQTDRIHQGLHWYHWRHTNYSLAFTEMKVKPLLSLQANCGPSVIPN